MKSEKEMLQEELEAVRAMYAAQCELTDEWIEAYRVDRADETLLSKIDELENSLRVMNEKYIAIVDMIWVKS